MMGLGLTAVQLDWKTDDTVRFVIPLGCLSTFFDTCGQLVPCQLASGLRIELLLEDAKIAMVQDTTTVTTSAYQIENGELRSTLAASTKAPRAG